LGAVNFSIIVSYQVACATLGALTYGLLIQQYIVRIALLLIILNLVSGAEDQIVITQEDEDKIIEYIVDFNHDISRIVNPRSSMLPYQQLQITHSFKNLITFDLKLMPYIVRQFQIQAEARVFVGAKLANRAINGLDDLQKYQQERVTNLKSTVKPMINFPGHWLIGQYLLGDWIKEEFDPMSDQKAFPYLQWWEKNQHLFIFNTENPIEIDRTYNYDSRPHITTHSDGDLLTIEAVGANTLHIIQRAAAELGSKIFIGEQQSMNMYGTVRMRDMTFAEFSFFIGRATSSRVEYQLINDTFHFGNPEFNYQVLLKECL